jgi:hypothetical protein
MKRRILASLCILLALLCCSSIITWARSYVSAEAVALSRRFEGYRLIGSDGRVLLSHGNLHFASPEVEQLWRSGIDPNIDIRKWSFSVLSEISPMPAVDNSVLGFGFQKAEFDMLRRRQIEGVTWHRTIVQVPYWFVAIITGAWPAAWLWKLSRSRSRRVEMGLCRRCGFDLAGVYYSCPKCGQRLPLPPFEVIAKTK